MLSKKFQVPCKTFEAQKQSELNSSPVLCPKHIGNTNNFTALRYLEDAVPQVAKKYNASWAVGFGHFGSVLLAQEKHKTDSPLYAIKLLDTSKNRIAALNEVAYLKRLRGADNVVQFVDLIDNGNYMAIITEYFKSDNFSEDFRLFTPRKVRLFLKNMLTAVETVHKLKVTHGDIKPTNFLFDMTKKKFLLIDLGMVMPFGERCKDRGTKGFIAPECILKLENSTYALDVFSVGVVFITMLSGVRPFFLGRSLEGLKEFCVMFGYRPLNRVIQKYKRVSFVGPTLSNLVNCKPLCLMKVCKLFRDYEYYEKRVNGGDKCVNCCQFQALCVCAKHDEKIFDNLKEVRDIFPPSTYDLLKRMLELDPCKRITVTEALNHPFFKEYLSNGFTVCQSPKILFKRGIINALTNRSGKSTTCNSSA